MQISIYTLLIMYLKIIKCGLFTNKFYFKNLHLISKATTLTFLPKNKKNQSKLYSMLYIPFQFKKTIFLNKSNIFILLILNPYFLVLPLNINNFNMMSGLLLFNYRNNDFMLYKSYLNKLFISFNSFFFFKLKFQGKGYRVYKGTRNLLGFQFNHSHLLYLYLFNVNFKLLNKFNLIFFGINVFNLKLLTLKMVNFRPINIFTLRGIRFTKSIIYKKVGKISSY